MLALNCVVETQNVQKCTVFFFLSFPLIRKSGGKSKDSKFRDIDSPLRVLCGHWSNFHKHFDFWTDDNYHYFTTVITTYKLDF